MDPISQPMLPSIIPFASVAAYGSGLAVRFVEQSPPPVKPSSVSAAQNRTIQDRLEELKKICEQELITEADCEAKRKSLVDSL